MPLCTRCCTRALCTRSSRLPIVQGRRAAEQRQWQSRRSMASMSPESQHKVPFNSENRCQVVSNFSPDAGCQPGRSRSYCIRDPPESTLYSRKPVPTRKLANILGCRRKGVRNISSTSFPRRILPRKLCLMRWAALCKVRKNIIQMEDWSAKGRRRQINTLKGTRALVTMAVMSI